MQRNYWIFGGAFRQIRMMLLGIAVNLSIALEVLSGLDRKQMVLSLVLPKLAWRNMRHPDFGQKRSRMTLVANSLALYLDHGIEEIY